MFLATLAFSLMQVCVKFVAHLPFHELILFRSVITLGISYAYIRKAGLQPWGNNRSVLIQRGVYGTIALSLWFLSIQKLPLASAATLFNLSPVFTAILAIFILKERVRNIQWLFFAAAFAGVVLIRGFDSNVQGIYVLAAVGGAFFSGLAYNMVRKLKDSDHPMVVIFYFPMVALPAAILWSLFDWVMPTGADWVFLSAIGIFAQLGQVLLTRALQLERAARISSITFFGVPIALLFSVFVFRESYNLVNIFGFALVSLGVILNIYISKKEIPGSEPSRN